MTPYISNDSNYADDNSWDLYSPPSPYPSTRPDSLASGQTWMLGQILKSVMVGAMAISDELLRLIIEKAALIQGFDHRLGSRGGHGNSGARHFYSFIGKLARNKWADQVLIDHPAIPETKIDFNFYIPSEATAIEIALGMRNPVSEYEKDILTALIAKDTGLDVNRLILVGKQGSIKARNAPGSKAIREWVKTRYNLTVEVHEFSRGGFGS